LTSFFFSFLHSLHIYYLLRLSSLNLSYIYLLTSTVFFFFFCLFSVYVLQLVDISPFFSFFPCILCCRPTPAT
jgi:hypothetical protein